MEKTRGKIVKLAAKLDNPNFVEKAPPEVVAKNREELGVLETQAGKLTESLAHLPSA